MTRPAASESTCDRIVGAAKDEFARHGIAGARVDRIAKSARTSKERVYAYFRSKEDLYRVVRAQQFAAVAEATRMDPADLPGYVGRVHDYFAAHPDTYRLMAWGQLELDSAEQSADESFQQAVAGKVDQLRRAQAAGQLDPAWDPLDVLVLLNQIAASWADKPDLCAAVPAPQRADYLAARRAAVVTAVQRLFPSASGPSERTP
ncbi:TetR family transcriptional regulator [Streptomycetaceae bacterium NBC_01309]